MSTRPVKISGHDLEQQARMTSDLLRLLHPDTRPALVYAVVTRVSASGMSRSVQFITYDAERGGMVDLSSRIAWLLDWRWSRDGVYVTGAGMDMIVHTLYSVYLALKRAGCGVPEDYSEFARYAG